MLKPLSKAMEDKDNIYAVIKGTSVNGDGNSIGLTAPNPKSQMKSLISACKDAGINGETLSYIEAHGTGTKLGDPIEIEGITKALAQFTDMKQFCGIGSVKTNIGHLDNCAGLAGFVKTVLMLKHKQMPPTLNFNVPNSKINFEKSPVYRHDVLRDWKEGETPRRCAVNAFGLSGTNCCIVLEEAPKVEESCEVIQAHIFKVSAKTENSLLKIIDRYIKYLENNNDDALGDICYTATLGRSDYKFRIAFVVEDKEELLSKLKFEYLKISNSVGGELSGDNK
jgi:acyl transferase domain-containing protein